MENYSIDQVAAILDVSNSVVLQWINKGWLKATQKSDRNKSPFVIKAHDLDRFKMSNHYKGKSKDIISNYPFGRTPILENCYPVNLALEALDYNEDSSDEFPSVDIWEIDFKKFKELIGSLNDREQRVVSMRFQFGMTLDEVGAALNVTRERVRQIQNVAIRKLKIKDCFVVPRALYSELKRKYEGLEIRMNEIMENEKFQECLEVAKEEDPVRFYSTKIEELNLNVRPFNCLKRAGIHTIGDIIAFDKYQSSPVEDVQFKYDNWLDIRNLGKKSLLEISDKIYEFCGYRLRYYDKEHGYYSDYIPVSCVPQFMDLWNLDSYNKTGGQ